MDRSGVFVGLDYHQGSQPWEAEDHHRDYRTPFARVGM